MEVERGGRYNTTPYSFKTLALALGCYKKEQVTTPPPIRLKPIQMACERGIVTLVLIDAAIKSRNTGRFVQTEGK